MVSKTKMILPLPQLREDEPNPLECWSQLGPSHAFLSNFMFSEAVPMA